MDDRPPDLKELMAHLAENMPPLTQEEEELLQRWAVSYPKATAAGEK